MLDSCWFQLHVVILAMQKLTTILDGPYFSLITWLACMLIGYLFFSWDGIQIMAGYYLQALIQFGFISADTILSEKDPVERNSSLVFNGLFFLGFSFFCLFGIYWANPFRGKFFSDIEWIFSPLISEGFWVLLVMIGSSAYSFYKYRRAREAKAETSELFGTRWIFHVISTLPFIALLALMFNGIAMVTPGLSFVMVVVTLGAHDVFWVNYSAKYLKKG